MKAKELRDLSKEELIEKEKDLSHELFNLRFQKATGQLGNSSILGKTKKDIARVKGILRELQISEEIERG